MPDVDVPVIHEATAPLGVNGSVVKGNVINEQQAVARRQGGLDVVVCGSDDRLNRTVAANIERQAVGVGNYIWHGAHKTSAGAHALNHYQPTSRPPQGHCFYETRGRKAT